MNPEEMSVREWIFGYHNCSESLLEDLKREGLEKEQGYWARAYDFVIKNGSFQVNRLSPHEFKWLETIRDDLLSEARQ